MRNLNKVLLVAVLLLIPSVSFSATARYFAEVKDNVVQRVIVAKSAEWCANILGGVWVETFIDIGLKNYAGKGYTYYPNKANFSTPKPADDATLDDSCNWHIPIKEVVVSDTVASDTGS